MSGLRRCGTCWLVLEEAESADDHAARSRWHVELREAQENRRASVESND